jgi:cold shock CspA family protein
MNSKTTGTVCRWNDSRGFGWAHVDSGGPDAFIHATELPSGAPAIGQRLRFMLMATAKGLRATEVELLTGGEHAQR